ncbi:mechanosensitive ion channel protein MscS [Pandoraea eparura]|jgi:small-conductance mechanosensitive channel|uniref:Mechanosensitive ion channel protein MscS n=1 Tax=Pandoraea eparura TaxID=2508291 RepID=A0A5E4RQ31_9BURK|nr:mechanosensitive ion channel domain-containing protein [Pandoraea eparura]VVD64871.1 mechanosensitive ion channel protein MscS [Pandoraea eparura]
MQESPAFARLVRDVVRDVGEPQIVWQVVALVGALAVAFVLRRWMIGRLERHFERVAPARRAGSSSLRRAFFPIFGWICVALTRVVLQDYTHVSLLKLAEVPLFGTALIYLAFYLARRLFATSPHASGLLKVFERVFTAIAWLSMLAYVLGVHDDILKWLASVRFAVGSSHLTLLSILSGLLWIGVTLVLAMWVGALVEDRIMRTTTLDGNLKVVLSRLIKGVLTLIAVLTTLSFVGIDITVLGVFGGALGVGLGFGLQKIASNLVSGFIILLDRSVRIGDLITVSPYHGTVSQINTRYTVVRGLDGVEALVPNEQLVTNVVQNHSFTETRGRAKVNVQVAYSADVELAMSLMLKAAVGIPRVLADPAPSALLLNFGADGMDLEMGFWVQDPAQGSGAIRSEINLRIWRTFREHGIEIPYAQREIRILNDWTDGLPVGGAPAPGVMAESPERAPSPADDVVQKPA